MITRTKRGGFVSVRLFTNHHDCDNLVISGIGICENDPKVGLVRSRARHREGAAGPDKIHNLPSQIRQRLGRFEVTLYCSCLGLCPAF